MSDSFGFFLGRFLGFEPWFLLVVIGGDRTVNNVSMLHISPKGGLVWKARVFRGWR